MVLPVNMAVCKYFATTLTQMAMMIVWFVLQRVLASIAVLLLLILNIALTLQN
jgi:hypothetical protein